VNHAPQIIIPGLALLALSSANVTAAPASATATNFEGCHALLNMGLYNVTQSDSAKSAEYQAMASFCAYDYSSSSISSSQAASIEASYGLFSGGGGYSGNRQEVITKQSQVCTLGFNSSKYWEKASAYSKTVYQGSLDAWNRCQELANKGMEFDVQPSSTMQGVNVSITAPSGYQAIFYGVTQHGQGRSTCKIMANGKITPISLTKPFTFDAASKVTVDCNRVMKKNGNDLSADAQDMIFVTSAKNLVVPLAAIGSFSRVTAENLKNQIETPLQSIIVAFNAASCPQGWMPADGSNGSPDLRGEFVRGLDSGRGVDVGRAVGSQQSHQLQSHTHRLTVFLTHAMEIPAKAGTGLFAPTIGPSASVDNWYPTSAPREENIGSETRPRNVALLYCVKK